MIVSLVLLFKSALINNSLCMFYKDSVHFLINTYNFTKKINPPEILISVLYVIIYYTFFPIALANACSILIHQSQTKVDSDAIFHCSFPWIFWDIKNCEQILNSLINNHWPFWAPRTLTSTAWSCIFDHCKISKHLDTAEQVFLWYLFVVS